MTALLDLTLLDKPVWVWGIFLGVVLLLLVLDLGVLNRKSHAVGLKESLILSAGYICCGLLFGGWVLIESGSDSAMDYYTAYVLEKMLSLDNLFVMSVIFANFMIPPEYQRRVLLWGILGVIVLRGVMIATGAVLVHNFAWVLYIFAGILIITGLKMMTMKEEESGADFSERPLIKFLKTHLPFTPAVVGHRFFVKVLPEDEDTMQTPTGRMRWVATPLFLALIVIELTDVMFAFDSVPAALAVTTDIYIVLTSNIFAILGLRALYFAMDHVLSRLAYMKYALAAVLIFIGLKVFYNGFIGHISPSISLLITLLVLAAGAVLSVYKTRANEENTSGPSAQG
ncbi:MAG: TerC/Alx family metal homeostasis membrane protein [Rhodospirillales bacterium]|nr:TerC/Alx family metal homeostasis membrane protein [Rhodospirillales bacterium]